MALPSNILVTELKYCNQPKILSIQDKDTTTKNHTEAFNKLYPTPSTTSCQLGYDYLCPQKQTQTKRSLLSLEPTNDDKIIDPSTSYTVIKTKYLPVTIKMTCVTKFQTTQEAKQAEKDICNQFDSAECKPSVVSVMPKITSLSPDLFKKNVIQAPIQDLKDGHENGKSDYHDHFSWIGDIPQGAYDWLNVLNKIVNTEENLTGFQKIVRRMNLLRDLAVNGQSQWIWDRQHIQQMLQNAHSNMKQNGIDQIENRFSSCDYNGDGVLSYMELYDCVASNGLRDHLDEKIM